MLFLFWQEKCAQYWPMSDQGRSEVHPFSLQLSNEKKTDSCIEREITVENLENPVSIFDLVRSQWGEFLKDRSPMRKENFIENQYFEKSINFPRLGKHFIFIL